MIDERERKKRRVQFLLLAALFTAPVVAAWVAWQYMGTHGVMSTTNTGTLITPARVIAPLRLTTPMARTLPGDYLRGRWTYVIFAPKDGCDEACQQQVFYTRQVRTSVNKDMHRVQRLLVLRQDPGESFVGQLQREHEDLQVAIVSAQEWPNLAGQFGIESDRADKLGLFLIDPLGNLMMAYGPEAPAKGVLKDLRKLLKVSQIG